MRGKKTDSSTRALCLKLRIDGRKSLSEISRETGVPKNTLRAWVRSYPLTRDEKARKHYGMKRKVNANKNSASESKYFQMIRGDVLSRARKMRISESAILFRAALLGLTVYGSPFDGDRSDWIISPDNKAFYKVQVKSVKQHRYGRPSVSLRCTSGHNKSTRYTEDDFDFIVGYDVITDTAYVFSYAETAHVSRCIVITDESKEAWDKIISRN